MKSVATKIVRAMVLPILLLFGSGCSLFEGFNLTGGLAGGELAAGVRAYEAGKYAEAEKNFNTALTRARAEDPAGADTERAWFWLAAAYQAQGKSYEAARALDEAVLAGDLGRARADADLGAMLDQPGEIYAERGRYEEAEQMLTRALRVKQQRFGERSVEAAATWNSLGVVYTMQGRYDRAERALLTALDIKQDTIGRDDPASAVTINNLGALYTRSGKSKQALAFLEEALKIRQDQLGPTHPDTLATLDNLGKYYLMGRDNDQAEQYFRQALAGDPGHYQALHNLGSLEVRRAEEALAAGDRTSGYEHLQKAIENYQAASESRPSAETYCDLGATILKASELQTSDDKKADLVRAAQSCFKLALDRDPGYYRALFELALLKWKQGEKDEAGALLDQAIASAPFNGALYYFKGYFLEERGQAGAALAAYEDCLMVSPCEEMCRAARTNLLKKQGVELCPTPD